jgi:hypothetical protein
VGKPQQITPQATSTLPAEFLPFARGLIEFLQQRQAQPFPNAQQQGLLSAFFGGSPQAGAPPTGPTLPSTPGVPVAPGIPGWMPGGPGGDPGGGPGGALLNFLMGGGRGRAPGASMAGPWAALGGRDAPWGGAGGTVGGLMQGRAESAARGSRIDALMDEMNAQREAMGLPPL